jgi:hypothetical protein
MLQQQQRLQEVLKAAQIHTACSNDAKLRGTTADNKVAVLSMYRTGNKRKDASHHRKFPLKSIIYLANC